MAYIGNQPLAGAYSLITLTESFNGVLTDFTMSESVGNANNLIIILSGVTQRWGVGFTVSGSTLTFTSAPEAGETISILKLGDTLSVGVPSDDSVTTAKLALPLPSIAIDWESKSTSFTAAAGKAYFCDTTGGTISVTLPSPTQKDTIRFLDVAGTFDTNNLTVLYGSSKIQGASSNLIVATERAGFALVYYDATQGWLLTEK